MPPDEPTKVKTTTNGKVEIPSGINVYTIRVKTTLNYPPEYDKLTLPGIAENHPRDGKFIDTDNLDCKPKTTLTEQLEDKLHYFSVETLPKTSNGTPRGSVRLTPR